MIKFSVLMSVYAKEKSDNLRLAIESIINQTYKPDEFVIVADGPLPVDLNRIIEEYKREYSKLIKVIYLRENMGLGKALDIGLLNCRNEYIARMDSDDISKLERFEKQFKYLSSNPQVDILGTSIDEFNEENIIISQRNVPLDDIEIKRYIKTRSPFNHRTVIFKKSKVMIFGGYGKLARKQDMDLFSRMLFNGCIGANLNESLLLFRSDNNNFKRRKSYNNISSYIKVIKKNYLRKYISLTDFLFVIFAQVLILLVPMWLFKIINRKILRKR